MLETGVESAGSIMPPYPWLYTSSIDKAATAGKITALRIIGVPYAEGYEEIANTDLDEQAESITTSLKEEDGIEIAKEAEIIALIAYLQRLGTDIKVQGETTASN